MQGGFAGAGYALPGGVRMCRCGSCDPTGSNHPNIRGKSNQAMEAKCSISALVNYVAKAAACRDGSEPYSAKSTS